MGVFRRLKKSLLGGRIGHMESRDKVDETMRVLNSKKGTTLPLASFEAARNVTSGTQIPGLIDPNLSDEWQEIAGYFALTKFEFTSPTPTFTPTFGVPVKVFRNKKTGEIRTFSAYHFES